MSQDNTQQDTPQESGEQFASLEEAVFGTEGSLDNTSSAFTDGTEGNQDTAPEGAPQGQPSHDGVEPQTEVSNEEKRYQYWQSRADKLKAENDRLKQTAMQTQHQAPPVQQPVATQEPAQDEFPPPPEKPERPRAFNREEAYNAPQSESARHLDDMEQWRDNMQEYNTLKTQYQGAVMEEKLHDMQQERVREAQRQQAIQKENAQARQIHEHVTANYGMSDSEATDFMHKMSNPQSLNIDNLVQLYRMQQGGAANAQTAPAQPSDAFQQTQNAQQVPSPMGVMPSGNAEVDGKSMEDKIMDTMIGNFNSKNPWK